jgi:hypothetical protein
MRLPDELVARHRDRVPLAGVRTCGRLARFRMESTTKLAGRSWVPVLMLIAVCVAAAHAKGGAVPPPAKASADAQHDFDFEIGRWKTHLKRKTHPVSGGGAWIEYDGTSVVRKVWNGKANLGELEIEGPPGHLEGLSLRVYNAKSEQWSIYWSNSSDPAIGSPMIGGFDSGRGEFYGQDTVEDRAIYARFIFSDISQTSFRLEQAFSLDGGKTWDPNWIATFTRDPS